MKAIAFKCVLVVAVSHSPPYLPVIFRTLKIGKVKCKFRSLKRNCVA
ncbi:Uncharacterised protein [Vibrio cholerae]|nr:Uncharacterised protein [Vibrio cholerae]